MSVVDVIAESPARQQWIDEGLRLLREQGHEGIRLERMCERLRLTRGSFYHHFTDRDAFVDALLDRWRAQQDAAMAARRASGRYADVVDLVAGLDHDLELALRTWSHVDPRVRKVTAKVDAARIAYMTEVLRGVLPADADAAFLAQLAYASLVGAQTLGVVNRTPQGVRAWNRSFLRAIHAKVSL